VVGHLIVTLRLLGQPGKVDILATRSSRLDGVVIKCLACIETQIDLILYQVSNEIFGLLRGLFRICLFSCISSFLFGLLRLFGLFPQLLRSLFSAFLLCPGSGEEKEEGRRT